MVTTSEIEVYVDREARRRNDIETMYGESLFGPMRTPTEFEYDPIELSIRGKKDRQNIQVYLKNAVEHAEELVKEQPEFDFYLRRCKVEQQEGRDLVNFMDDESCNVKIVVSDFPLELMHETGSVANFDCDRKLAYLRVYAKENDTLMMYSQSLEGSDRQGLERIYEFLGVQPKQGELLSQNVDTTIPDTLFASLVDKLTSVYDEFLQQKHGIRHYAGIPMYQHRMVDTYTFAKQQEDIIGLALQYDRQGVLNEVKNYNLLSLLRQRYESAVQGLEVVLPIVRMSPADVAIHYTVLEQQSKQAGQEARKQGVEYRACGVAITAGATTQERLEGAGFAKSLEQDRLGPLEFKCTQGHWNKRKPNEIITKCRVASCKEGSVGCGKPPKKAKK